MAHKKGHKKTRRRRVGGLGSKKDLLLTAAAAAAGLFLVGDAVNAGIDKLNTKTTTPATGTTPAVTSTRVSPTIVTVGEGGLGALLAFSKGGGIVGTAKKVAGGLILGAALRRIAKNMGVIKGYQFTPVLGRRMAGYQATPVIGGMPSSLTGYVNQGSGVGAVPGALTGYINQGSASNVMGSTEYRNGSGYMN